MMNDSLIYKGNGCGCFKLGLEKNKSVSGLFFS